MVKPTSTSPREHVSDSSSSSKYKGARKRKWGKWVSEIRLPNSRERIWLGSYDSAKKAAKAFDAALYCLRGPDANFNFPENPPEIIGGRSLSLPEIQVVAAKFANQVDEHNTGRTPGNDNNETTSNNNSSNNDNYVGIERYTSSSSAAIEIENHEIGWSSFLSTLDTDQEISDYGFFSPMSHHLSGELYPSLPIDDNVDDDQNDGDDLSQSLSFLWNF